MENIWMNKTACFLVTQAVKKS